MRVLGAVISGGQSRRMAGREKAFLTLAGVSLMERVISRIAPQVETVVINANGDAARFSIWRKEVIADELALTTPLSGLHAVLRYGETNGFDAVLTVPSDTPLLPLNLVSRLSEAGATTGAAIASSAGQKHYLTGLWSCAMTGKLEEFIMRETLQRVKDVATVFEVAEAQWPSEPHDPFFNINTPEDLAAAELLLA